MMQYIVFAIYRDRKRSHLLQSCCTAFFHLWCVAFFHSLMHCIFFHFCYVASSSSLFVEFFLTLFCSIFFQLCLFFYLFPSVTVKIPSLALLIFHPVHCICYIANCPAMHCVFSACCVASPSISDDLLCCVFFAS